MGMLGSEPSFLQHTAPLRAEKGKSPLSQTAPLNLGSFRGVRRWMRLQLFSPPSLNFTFRLCYHGESDPLSISLCAVEAHAGLLQHV